MPSDSDLRRRFQEGTQPRGEIDLDAVLRRARARRRPRVVVAAAGSVLAIAAIAVPAVITSYTGAGSSTDTAFVAGDEAAAPESSTVGGGAVDSDLAEAKRINLCEAPVAEPVPAANGLTVSAEPVTAPAAEGSIPVTVTLTNGGTQQIFGTTGTRPVLTLSRDGVTIWHTNGPADLMARIVDLGPGESMTYETTFEPVVCGAEDDMAESFRDDLPAAGPGTYLLSAVIEVSHDDGSAVDLVTGPAVAVTLT